MLSILEAAAFILPSLIGHYMNNYYYPHGIYTLYYIAHLMRAPQKYIQWKRRRAIMQKNDGLI